MNDVVTISPEIQSGTPVFTGTRVPIKNLFDYLKGGDTIEEFLEDFPSVKKEQVLKLLGLAENTFTYDNRFKTLVSKIEEVESKITESDPKEKIIEIDLRAE
ncbi:MAG: DUF433 domain-containing protein [Aridibacter sp.]